MDAAAAQRRPGRCRGSSSRRRRGDLHGRLRRPARAGRARGQRHHGAAKRARRRRRGRARSSSGRRPRAPAACSTSTARAARPTSTSTSTTTCTRRNDNEGGCKPGVSYAHGAEERSQGRGRRARSATSATPATPTGSRRTSTSRCTRRRRGAVSRSRYLKKAKRLLFAAAAGLAVHARAERHGRAARTTAFSSTSTRCACGRAAARPSRPARGCRSGAARPRRSRRRAAAGSGSRSTRSAARSSGGCR